MSNRELIISQFHEVIKNYPSLILYWKDDMAVIEGDLHFVATFNEVRIQDVYQIQITIPSNYPNSLPNTKEVGRKISSSFHHFTNGFLCLEVDTKIKLEFAENPTLLFYIQKYVIQYLYSYSYLKQYRELPYGERSHGELGIIEFYQELFNVTKVTSIAGALAILEKGTYRGHHLCFCDSGLKLRDCHGELIKRLIDKNLKEEFKNDLIAIIDYSRNRRRRL